MSAQQVIKQTILLSLGISIFPMEAPSQTQRRFWAEKDNGADNLVSLPQLAPIIDLVDHTVVNIATTSEPKVDHRWGPMQQDPFMNPEDFFERFFNMPFGERQRQPRRSLGSGFIISKDGYIVTNNHVIEGADKVEVSLQNDERGPRRGRRGEKFEAKIVGRDAATDLALIKIDAGRDLPFVPLGDSAKLRKGDWVLAFGNPFGLDHSVSLGIVSATGREISPNENRRFDDFIQTDAAINFGNSGGPLVNLKGEVIGVNTAISAQGSGIGFAVPVNILKEVIAQLRDSGSVSRGYLGVMIQDVTDEMKDALGLKEAKGVVVNDIPPTGPAAKSQLQRGDVITKVNGVEIGDSRGLQKNVAALKPGSTANLEVIRDKKAIQIPVKVGNLGEDEDKEKGSPGDSGKADRLGLSVQDAPDRSGLIIADVERNSVAGRSGIVPGDLIRSINGETVKATKDYNRIVKGLKSKQTVLFDLERRGAKLFIAFRVP